MRLEVRFSNGTRFLSVSLLYLGPGSFQFTADREIRTETKPLTCTAIAQQGKRRARVPGSGELEGRVDDGLGRAVPPLSGPVDQVHDVLVAQIVPHACEMKCKGRTKEVLSGVDAHACAPAKTPRAKTSFPPRTPVSTQRPGTYPHLCKNKRLNRLVGQKGKRSTPFTLLRCRRKCHNQGAGRPRKLRCVSLKSWCEVSQPRELDVAVRFSTTNRPFHRPPPMTASQPSSPPAGRLSNDMA